MQFKIKKYLKKKNPENSQINKKLLDGEENNRMWG